MKNKKINYLKNFVIRAIVLFVVIQQGHAISVKQHNNKLTFVHGQVWTEDGRVKDVHWKNIKVGFQVTQSCITNNQPYGGVTTDKNHIIVKAGRHSSKYVKNCFKKWITNKESIFDKMPKKLNFAVKGKLTLSIIDSSGHVEKDATAVFNDIVFAQGHNANGNNWWMGGEHCKVSDISTITCTSELHKPALTFSFDMDTAHNSRIHFTYTHLT